MRDQQHDLILIVWDTVWQEQYFTGRSEDDLLALSQELNFSSRLCNVLARLPPGQSKAFLHSSQAWKFNPSCLSPGVLSQTKSTEWTTDPFRLFSPHSKDLYQSQNSKGFYVLWPDKIPVMNTLLTGLTHRSKAERGSKHFCINSEWCFTGRTWMQTNWEDIFISYAECFKYKAYTFTLLNIFKYTLEKGISVWVCWVGIFNVLYKITYSIFRQCLFYELYFHKACWRLILFELCFRNV